LGIREYIGRCGKSRECNSRFGKRALEASWIDIYGSLNSERLVDALTVMMRHI
ncbi:hypothetical protein Dimus_036607, partial [Dionaea muscipula]